MNTYSFSFAEQKTDGADNAATQRKIYTIGIAEQKLVQAPDRLSTLGLGSCVGLVLYDAISRTAGMVHIMLPSAPKDMPVTNTSKFADTAIPALIRQLMQSGTLRGRLTAKLGGGAHMFNTTYNTDVMNVGDRNVQMCKKVLAEHGISISAEETGGTCGRSIEFCCETGMLQVRTVSPKSIRLI
jgi:chemotaxis protein CheD